MTYFSDKDTAFCWKEVSFIESFFVLIVKKIEK